MLSVIQHFFSGAQLPADTLGRLERYVTTKHVAKGQLLLRKGDLSGKGYFVQQGCLRSYSVDAKGKEHIFMFAPEGWIIGDMELQATGKPAALYIDAIENSTLEVFDNTAIELLSSLQQVGMGNGYSKLMKRVAVMQRRIILLMSATAQERYEDFITTYPDIVQRVPQKMIASYLGITPQALSKIRGEIARKK